MSSKENISPEVAGGLAHPSRSMLLHDIRSPSVRKASFFTAFNSLYVTNNLYRKRRKCKIGNMCERTTTFTVGCPKPAANSLFRNILPLSACGSIFCLYPRHISHSQDYENKDFREQVSKNCKYRYPRLSTRLTPLAALPRLQSRASRGPFMGWLQNKFEKNFIDQHG